MLNFFKAWFSHLTWREVFQIFRVNTVKGPDGPIMTQVNVIGILGWTLRLHLFFRGDGDDYHSHPRSFVSLCVWGRYYERLLPSGARTVNPGTFSCLRATRTHNVTPLTKLCVTLVAVAPVTRQWEKVQSPSKKRIVLIGLPGAGKGTQGAYLSKLLNVPHVSVGDFVREQVASQTKLGQQVVKHWQNGSWKPLPDALAVQVTQQALAGKNGWILDGFPRNVAQAKQGADVLRGIDLVIHFVVSETTSQHRVEQRAREKQSLWRARASHERQRLPLLVMHLRKNFPYVQIDSEGTVEQTKTRLLELFQKGLF